MNRQEHYRAQYRALHPDWQDSLAIYRAAVAALVDQNTRILDIGCGHAEVLREAFAKTEHTYGIDPDASALAKNTIIQNKSVGTTDALPFPDQFFDVVVSAWVFEHLEHPTKAFREIHRVLKPGGKVVFLTPNACNYVVWINRLIPDRFHDFLTKKLYGRQEHDTYPVRYRVNTPQTIECVLKDAGFTKEQLILNGDPSYISFNDVLFRLACGIEAIIDHWFRACKVHLIGVYKKRGE